MSRMSVFVLSACAVVAAGACSDQSFEPNGGASAGTDGGADAGASGAGGASGASGAGAAGLSGGAGSAGSAGASGAAGEPGDGGVTDGAAGAAGGAGGAGGAGDAGADSGGPLPNGSSCSAATQCLSGRCVDAVCCNTACDSKCESCKVVGKLGTCSPQPSGQDPDAECKGSSSACSGACDGKGACSYPAASSCGNLTCTAGTQHVPLCNGLGGCAVTSTKCAPYVCGASSCKTSCAADTDCVSGYFCNPAKKCEVKRANGGACSGTSWCSSGNCVSGVCCNTACPGANFSCSTGTCSCGGKVCGASEACVDWFRDSDNDGYGDAKVKALGCSTSGTAQGGYVNDSKDCYDKNANAWPGQTAFFSAHRGDGSFDYDCDGQQKRERLTLSPSGTCRMCTHKPACLQGPGFCDDGCGYWPNVAWSEEVPDCGVTGDWALCTESPINGNPVKISSYEPQACR